MEQDDPKALVDRLKGHFDARLPDYAPTLRRPVSWSEILLLSVN